MAFKEGSKREEAAESPAEERAENARYAPMREKGDMKMRAPGKKAGKRFGGRGGKR